MTKSNGHLVEISFICKVAISSEKYSIDLREVKQNLSQILKIE